MLTLHFLLLQPVSFMFHQYPTLTASCLIVIITSLIIAIFIRMIITCLGELMRSGSVGQSFEGVYDYVPPVMEMGPATFRCSLTVDKHFLLICMKVTPIQLRTRLSQNTLTQHFTLSFRRYHIILTPRQEI